MQIVYTLIQVVLSKEEIAMKDQDTIGSVVKIFV